MYATLNILNQDDRNIITVEDPVEYRLDGVNQIQVNPKAGLTFASALRSILRADPDIVLIGEIRDKETATIAIEAALTGHLVLSSLHTNDAAVGDLPSGRDGGRDVPGGVRDRLRRRPAALSASSVSGARRRTSPSTPSCSAAGYPEWLLAGDRDALPARGLLRLLEHRVPRAGTVCTRSCR